MMPVGHPRPKDQLPVVSIVVPTRNEEQSIGECLAALTAQTYPADRLEIIVADGGSTDRTAVIVEEQARSHPNVRLITNPERVTPAGFNIGIRASAGSVIGVMSGHGAPAPNYVELAVAVLEATGAWCVGGRIDRRAEGSVALAVASATSSPFGVGDAVHNYSPDARWVETAFPGLWPRAVFARVGLFDRELLRNQDDELAFRIREAGGQIWYDPELVVRYRVRSGFRALFSQYRQYGLWKVRVFQKHPRAARIRHLVPAAWVSAVGAGVIVAPIHPVGAALLAAAVGPYLLIMAIAAMRLGIGGVSRLLVLAALVTLHTAYGAGFLQGLVRFAPRWLRGRRGRVEKLDLATER